MRGDVGGRVEPACLVVGGRSDQLRSGNHYTRGAVDEA